MVDVVNQQHHALLPMLLLLVLLEAQLCLLQQAVPAGLQAQELQRLAVSTAGYCAPPCLVSMYSMHSPAMLQL
jgi:hypothetical protein